MNFIGISKIPLNFVRIPLVKAKGAEEFFTKEDLGDSVENYPKLGNHTPD